jgi:hypothetical protein
VQVIKQGSTTSLKPDRCWVLLRHDMTWHVARVAYRDAPRLSERGPLCKEMAPIDADDLLAYTHSQPCRRGLLTCPRCEASAYPDRADPRPALEAHIDRLLDQLAFAYEAIDDLQHQRAPG